MKKLGTLLSVILLLNIGSFANGQDTHGVEPKSTPLRNVNHSAFKVGEVLKYKLAYGFISAGEAELTVSKAEKQIQGRDVLHMVGVGRSISAFDWFFKVRDRYETYMDEQGVFPWLFVRRISEGGYNKEQDYKFFQNNGTVINQKEEKYDVPHGVQDMLSAFYYARTLNFKQAKKGQIFEFQAFVDEEVYPVRMKYVGTKKVKIGVGKFDCLVFNPAVQEGRIFESDEDLTVYITNDENKVPILVKAKVLVGSIRMELTDYSNLANPIAKLD
ncbi:MAG: DUF3108 domain-containing protein [Bacteroidetes bacterium]|nr:DUF3108 domain-containing protein [Flavobacteriales bacterium]NOG56801.1 DUF3108 domain-containing protein [Bacteroidota bacterium]